MNLLPASPRYCYWSVCDGPYAAWMERCVASARQAGVFKPFHVFTRQPIGGCECYEAFEFEADRHLFKLIYLKAGMTKLNFDYYVWVDADTVFLRNPLNILGALGRSPIHVPLTTNLSGLAPDEPLGPITGRRYAELMQRAGVLNPVFYSRSAFWIVHHDAIERVCDLALHFLAFAKEDDVALDVNAGLGYAMQMLCANPKAHRLAVRPDLWASDDYGCVSGKEIDHGTWEWQDPWRSERVQVQPAIMHVPRQKDAAARNVSPKDNPQPQPAICIQ
jgi:hypothetical protein